MLHSRFANEAQVLVCELNRVKLENMKNQPNNTYIPYKWPVSFQQLLDTTRNTNPPTQAKLRNLYCAFPHIGALWSASLGPMIGALVGTSSSNTHFSHKVHGPFGLPKPQFF